MEFLVRPNFPEPKDEYAQSGAQRLFTRQRSLYLAVFLVVLLLWSIDTRMLPRPMYELDDPYITLHNAQVILSGHDLNYQGTPPLVGATSPVHLLLVTALLPFVQPLWAPQIANWLAILLYSLGLARLAFQHRANCSQAALLVAAGLLVARTPAILLNGLETGLAMAGVVWALVGATTPRPTRWLPALCGLLPFLRPELVALSSLLMLHQFWRHWEARRCVRSAVRAAAIDVALAAAAAAPWILWYWIGTGVPYASTIEAKRDFFAGGRRSLGDKTLVVIGALEKFFLALGTLGWGAATLPSTRVGRLGLLFCVLFIAAYLAEFPEALWHNGQRYLYLLLPFLLYGAASWLASPREGPRFAATCLLLAAVAQSIATFVPRWNVFTVGRELETAQLETVADWCRGHLPPQTRLLIHDAGFISCVTSFPLTDMVGPKTPASIQEHRELTWASGGRRRAEAIQKIALRSHAHYLIVTQGWNDDFHITDGLQKLGWKASEQTPPRDYYQVYHLTPPFPSSVRSPQVNLSRGVLAQRQLGAGSPAPDPSPARAGAGDRANWR